MYQHAQTVGRWNSEVRSAPQQGRLRRIVDHIEDRAWLRQGFDESDLVRGGSDRLAAGIVGMGSVDQAAAMVTDHLDAGADHVVVQVLGDGNPAWDPRPALRELAGVLGLSATA